MAFNRAFSVRPSELVLAVTLMCWHLRSYFMGCCSPEKSCSCYANDAMPIMPRHKLMSAHMSSGKTIYRFACEIIVGAKMRSHFGVAYNLLCCSKSSGDYCRHSSKLRMQYQSPSLYMRRSLG